MKEIKKNTVPFVGTTEGGLLAEYLQELNRPFVICATTGYARDLPEDICGPDQAGYVEIRRRHLNVTEVGQMSDELWPGPIIDATHPYVVEVTRNIRIACSGRRELWLIRCLREPGTEDSRPGMGVVHMPGAGVVYMPDVEMVVTWLSFVTGNILVTTGSKELSSYIRIRGYEQRIYAKVLPSEEAVARCRSLGFEGRHIIAVQGPFSEKMNLTQLREYGCAHLVTEDDGTIGEFSEETKTARRAGAVAMVIDQPGSEEGIPLDEIKG